MTARLYRIFIEQHLTDTFTDSSGYIEIVRYTKAVYSPSEFEEEQKPSFGNPIQKFSYYWVARQMVRGILLERPTGKIIKEVNADDFRFRVWVAKKIAEKEKDLTFDLKHFKPFSQ